jgi:hypothetical protein
VVLGGAQYNAIGTTPGSANRWNYLTGVLKPQNGGLAFDVNGVQEGTNGTTASTLRNDTTIGVRFGLGTDVGYSGALDEVHISNIARSSNWVWACYLNMALNTSFQTYGAMPPRGMTVFFR